MHASRNLTFFLEPVFLVRRTDGNFEFLTTATKIKNFFPFSPASRLEKFYCNSSFGSGSEVFAVLDDLGLIPIFVHSMHI